MRDSVGMLDQAKSYSEERITIEDIHDINGTLTEKDLEEILEDIEDKNLEKILEKTDKYNEKGKNFTKLIEEFINYLRNVLLYKKVPNYFKNTHKNIENYEKIVKKITVENILKYIEILNKYTVEMKNTNNTKLTFELAFIQIISENDSGNEQTLKQEINSPKIVENSVKETRKEKQEIDKKEEKEKKVEKPVKEENNILKKQLEEIKKIRVDNTLSKFNKKTLIELKSKLEERIKELLLNPDYSQSASMILDGTLKAASEENLIFVYKTNRISNLFNENLIKIQNTIEKALNKKYNLIAVDMDEWDIIKDDYNHKKKTIYL